MVISALVLAQAVAGPHLPAPRRPPSDAPCPVAIDSADVIVRGRTDERYRLKPLPQVGEPQAIPKAQVRLGPGALAAEAEQATLAGGQQSQRLMLRWKLPIGRKKRS